MKSSLSHFASDGRSALTGVRACALRRSQFDLTVPVLANHSVRRCHDLVSRESTQSKLMEPDSLGGQKITHATHNSKAHLQDDSGAYRSGGVLAPELVGVDSTIGTSMKPVLPGGDRYASVRFNGDKLVITKTPEVVQLNRETAQPLAKELSEIVGVTPASPATFPPLCDTSSPVEHGAAVLLLPAAPFNL